METIYKALMIGGWCITLAAVVLGFSDYLAGGGDTEALGRGITLGVLGLLIYGIPKILLLRLS